MTLIIGAKFGDGVILVSDRKVTEADGRFSYTTKIIMPEGLPLFFGAAGFSHKAKQFNRKIQEKVAERNREINLENFSIYKELGIPAPTSKKKVELKKFDTKDLKDKKEDFDEEEIPLPLHIYSAERFIEDCQGLIKNICLEDGASSPDLDVLLALSSPSEARLHHINFVGDEEELNYHAIGSGSDFVRGFLRKHWREDMTIEEILTLCFFCIYYVQDLDFDSGVGMEDNILPDHMVITDGGANMGTWKELEEKKEEIIINIRKDISKIKDIQDSLKF